MPDWQSLDANKRLLAAVIAAHPDKKLLDYRKIATYYGEGTTYDSIEGQFRKIRKEAEKMKQKVDSGEQTEAPPRGNKKDGDSGAKPTKARKPRISPKKQDGVISGRVTKSITPTKKRGVDQNAVKGVKEEMESSASSMMEGHLGGSFDDGDGDFDFSFGVDGLGDENDYIGDEV
ncbi:hypothetical protein MMC30_001421 [Trapelia coarctata]|nr:hypothetical protein [Trapelia coarctata]